MSREDLEYLVKCGIQVPLLSIAVLRASSTAEFVAYISVIRLLKGLREFGIVEWHFHDPLPYDLYKALPTIK